ncbi:MAG TPA: non-homologous end-joining DNA ligase [Terriglobales bacterium]|nr:non-homologous end-joining DNA ligase [Terriglobales bacterium]
MLFPSTGFATDDLVDFYASIAPVLLPHLAHRPLTLKRFPDDIKGESFWEKDIPSFFPKWIKTFAVPRVNEPTDIHYINICNAKTLVFAAQIGCVEIHPFLHCFPAIQQPTAIVFDLDPGPPANIIDCCRVAVLLRDFLAEHGLETLVKASGSKGLQVYAPLNTRTTYAITQPFAKRVAENLAQRNPGLILSEMARDLRPGKVFIDWSQNAWHKTTVGVYSVRAKRERPFVSMPLKWAELQRAVESGEHDGLYFEPDKALSRVEELGDLFKPVLHLKQQLPTELLREWDIEATLSDIPTPAQSRRSKVQTAPGLPRSSGQGGRRLFVIHRIQWADWEYELSLEENGEFICWDLGFALPITAGGDADAKQAHTEDLKYLTFETPKSIVWDLGTYEVVEGSVAKGDVRIYLSGRKLEGELSLTKATEKRWKVVNSGMAVKDNSRLDESALTAADVPAKRSNTKAATKKSPVRQVLDLAALPKAEPKFIKPMECSEVGSPEQLPHDPAQWLYKIKWDGFRCEVVKENGNTRLLTRRGNEPNARYKHILEALEASSLPDCVLDGELVALSKDGVPEFQLLQNSRHNDAPVVFVAFDVLNCQGHDLTGIPLEDRKQLLVSLGPILPAQAALISEGLEGNLDQIITVIEQKGLEGVVVKRRSSLYHAGKDKFEGWVKYRISEVDEFVIGGYMRRSDPVFDALVVGQYQNGKLLYKEKIRFGFEGGDKREIVKSLEHLRVRTCPFANLPQKKRRGALDEAQMRECTWVRPELWCEMEFPEWTNTGEIRGHGKFRQIIRRKQRAA